MSRSEEIRVQLEELKARKEGRSKEAYSLREELKALESPPDPKPTPFDAVVAPAVAAEVPEDSVFDSDEYRFLEKCCQEMGMPKGSSPAKSLYNEIAAKRMAWITLREVIQDVGVGKPTWPQYAELDRNDRTGEKTADYEARQKFEIAKAEALKKADAEEAKRKREEAQAASTTRTVIAAPPSDLDNMAAAVAAQVRADFAARPEPEMGKTPAPTAAE